MDLLKTLLFYMIISTSGATLDAGVTPIPYDVLNTPTPVVTPTQVPTPTPPPTATPTPTLTPVTRHAGRVGTRMCACFSSGCTSWVIWRKRPTASTAK